MSFADAGITSPADFAGKNIGNWGFGNEYEVFAALTRRASTRRPTSTSCSSSSTWSACSTGDIDAAEAMTYNEYAQVLEAENPDTGELYTPEDFNVISYEDVGVGMLQDAIWADGERLGRRPAYRTSPSASSPRRSRAGRTAGTTPRSAATSSSPPGSQLGSSHQLWQMNEVNKLIWPAENGIGFIDQDGVGPHRRDRPEHAQPRRHDGAHRDRRPRAPSPTTSSRPPALLGDSVDTTARTSSRSRSRWPGGG